MTTIVTTRSRRFAVLVVALVVGVSGCSGSGPGQSAPSALPGLPTSAATTTGTTSKTSAAKAADADYARLLLTAADLSDAEDTFNPRSSDPKPMSVPGASAFFVNEEDTRAISDTLMIYPDAAAASAALRQASGALTTQVAGGAPTPSPVGTDGVTVTGTYPANQKAVTLLLFTEGAALVRLEFQSATGDRTTERFITSIGKMQQIALRVGLANPQ